MKRIDEEIRKVFSEKLSEVEMDVSPHLWEAVQSKLAANAVGSTAAAGTSKLIGFKVIAAATSLLVAVTALTYFINRNNETSEVKAQSKFEQKSIESEANMPEATMEADSDHLSVSSANETSPIKEDFDVPTSNANVENPHLSKDRQGESILHNTQKEEVNADKEDAVPTANQTTHMESNELADATLETYQLSGSFQIIPADLEEMRYSFLASDATAKYEWDFGDDTRSTDRQAVHQYENEGTYDVTLTVISNSGVRKTSTHELTVYKPGKLIVPNIFTPNGDGSNDYFDPSIKSEGVTFTKIIVSNSQGRIVFESNELRLWDGNDQSGNACTGGTYQYYISGFDRNHEVLENKGAVVLIR